MLSNTLIKIRAGIIFALALPFYPLLLLCAVFAKVFEKLSYFRVEKSIKNEIAVVTGAGHGLGKEIAIELAKRGCHVAVADINIEGAESTAKYIIDTFDVKAKAYKINVSSYEQIVELNKQVTQDLGTTTVLINNAGILLHGNPLKPDYKDVQRMIDVNLTSHFWTNSVFLPEMKRLRKGYLMSISSPASWFPLAFSSVYTATKFGVTGYMRALRQELLLEGHSNIHLSTALPFFMNTNTKVEELVDKMHISKLYPSESGEFVAKRIVSGMLLNEEEIAVPSIMALIYRLSILLPASWQTRIPALIMGSILRKFMDKNLFK